MTRAIARDDRLNMRLTSIAKADLSLGAELSGQDLTSFVLDSALSRARTLILENAAVRLTRGDVDLLRSAIDSPAVESEALKRLFERAGE